MKTSPSRMSDFFTCPAKFQFHRKWKITELYPMPPALTTGTAVHALLEGKIHGFQISPEVEYYYKRLNKLRKELDYEIIATEEFQTVSADQHKLMRVIDACAVTPDGSYVLVDYKTANYQWSRVGEDAPQGMGFQAAAYMIPPDDPAPFPSWPTELHFLVAPNFKFTDKGRRVGEPEVVVYHRNQEDEENLLNALDLMASTKVFVKNRGHNCRHCSFKELCFQTPGWEKLYERKDRKNGRTKKAS